MLDMVNNSSSETLILNPREALGILDVRSLGYYKIKQGAIQQKLGRYYEFALTDKVCTQFNNLTNTLRKEQSLDTGEKFPWLDNSDERKYMSDSEMLRKYINLDNACFTEDEKKEVMEMYQYKEAFSLRDEIGTCLNIEVGIDMMDKSPFFIRPYHVREEDKKVIDREMKYLYVNVDFSSCFFHMFSSLFLINRTIFVSETSFQQVLLSSSGPKENIFISKFIYP